ncbi:Uncharacterised protein [Mycobacterium tuberculosis]|nr:Uncharacterised protein [Mycobacterium tuberculosis]
MSAPLNTCAMSGPGAPSTAAAKASIEASAWLSSARTSQRSHGVGEE